MARPPTLSFDRGTLLLHPPPPGKAWIDYATWDDRVERFRIRALHYRRLVEALNAAGTPLLDLMHQWYAHLLAAFPDAPVGLLGGGARDSTPLLVATYDSAAISAEALGNKYALLVFDECHHLPGEFTRVIAEYSLAPYRLGLTATPERSDGKHADLEALIGPEVYRTSAAALSGSVLAPYRVVRLTVRLSPRERQRYDAMLETRNHFLQ